MKILTQVSFVSIGVVIALTFCLAQNITSPDLTPSRTNQEEQAIIDEGITLHDQGKFDAAIAKYKQVLDKNPKNVLALYKMAFSYFAAAKYEESLKAATQGARYKSDYLPQFYMMIGNSLNKLGKTNDAISAFKQALEILPNDALIHYNLAVMLFNTEAFDDARSHLKTAIQLNPKHASSHYALGQIYYKQEYRFPCALALFRFLTLEPASQRSKKAVEMLQDNFKTETAGNVPKEEGDFSKYELILPSIQASNPKKAELMDKLFSLMAEMNEKEKGKFVIDYYFPYFMALKKNGLVAPFTYYIFQSADNESSLWVKNHPDEVNRFIEWSSNFQFTPSTVHP